MEIENLKREIIETEIKLEQEINKVLEVFKEKTKIDGISIRISETIKFREGREYNNNDGAVYCHCHLDIYL